MAEAHALRAWKASVWRGYEWAVVRQAVALHALLRVRLCDASAVVEVEARG